MACVAWIESACRHGHYFLAPQSFHVDKWADAFSPNARKKKSKFFRQYLDLKSSHYSSLEAISSTVSGQQNLSMQIMSSPKSDTWAQTACFTGEFYNIKGRIISILHISSRNLKERECFSPNSIDTNYSNTKTRQRHHKKTTD